MLKTINSDGSLSITLIGSSVPAGAVYNSGFAYTPAGSLYVKFADLQLSGQVYNGGLACTPDGALYVTTDDPDSSSASRRGMLCRYDGAVHLSDAGLSSISYSGGIPTDSAGALYCNVPELVLNLTHTAIPVRGNITPNFTRATEKRIPGHEGILHTCISGELGFPGARRVRNLVSTKSEDWTNAAWTKNDVTISGTTKIVESATNATHYITQTITTVSGNKYILSFTALAAERSLLWVNHNGTGSYTDSFFNLATGVVGTAGTGSTLGIEDLGGGEYRCSLSYTCGTASTQISVGIATGAEVTTYLGDITKGLYVNNAQLEDITGRTDQTTPSEYVSVGVASSPAYHGSMVDGVKCFPTDLDGNALPTRATYEAVSLPGVAGSYVSTPDSVANSITGDIEAIWSGTLVSPTSATAQMLFSKANGGIPSFSYDCYLVSSQVIFRVSTDGGIGAGLKSSTSNAIAGLVSGTKYWFKVSRVASTGVVSVAYSTDGISYTPVTVTSGGSGNIADTAIQLAIGIQADGVSTPILGGKCYSLTIAPGAGQTPTVSFDASRYEGGTTLTGPTGETWTLNGNAVIHKTNNPMTTPLIELAATNLCLQSNAFTTAPWTSYLTPTPTQDAIGPDGGTTAWTLTDNDGADVEEVYQDIAITAAAYTFSIFVEKTTGAQSSYPALRWFIPGLTQCAACTIDTTNGVATAWTAMTGFTMASGVSASCVSFNSELWRVSLTKTGTAATHRIELITAATANATQSTGSFSAAAQGSAVFYGAQVELGTAATSYIPTTTAAATRNADQLYYTGADIANIKTLAAVDFKRESGFADVGIVTSASDGTSNNFSRFALASATAVYFQGAGGGVNTWNTLAANAYTPGALSSIAQSFATNDVKMAKDSVAQTADTSATVPTVSRLEYGMTEGVAQLNGYPGKIYGWTRNLSQSELDAVTR